MGPLCMPKMASLAYAWASLGLDNLFLSCFYSYAYAERCRTMCVTWKHMSTVWRIIACDKAPVGSCGGSVETHGGGRLPDQCWGVFLAGLFSTSSWKSTSPAFIVLSAPSVVLIFLHTFIKLNNKVICGKHPLANTDRTGYTAGTSKGTFLLCDSPCLLQQYAQY